MSKLTLLKSQITVRLITDVQGSDIAYWEYDLQENTHTFDLEEIENIEADNINTQKSLTKTDISVSILQDRS